MNCDQIIYIGIFTIVAIYLYQNYSMPNFIRGDGFTVSAEVAAQDATNAANVAYAEAQNAKASAQVAAQEASASALLNLSASNQDPNSVHASEKFGHNEMNAPVKFNRTPSTCYPDKSLTSADLLPSEEAAEISEFNQNYPIGKGILKGINFLSSGYSIGVNTVGQSLKNANRQLRSEPPNPQVSVSPWMNSSIGPDLLRRPLEVDNSCGK